MKKMFYLFMLLIFSSCNQQRMENQVNDLKKVIEEQELIINDLRSEVFQLKQLIDDRKRIKQYSDEEIINIVKNDQEYYCPEGIRKNFVVRRIDENTFDVRFNFKYPSNDLFDYTIMRITFLPNDKYTLSHKSGRVC